MSTIVPKTTRGALNSATPVDIVTFTGAPVDRTEVRKLMFKNKDTVQVALTPRFHDTAGLSELPTAILDPGETATYDDVWVLDHADKKISAVLATPVTTAQPTWVCSFADVTD